MTDTNTHRFSQAASMVKVQGIMSIVFGSIGSLVGLIILSIFAVSLGNAYTTADAIAFLFLFLLVVFVWLIPHMYLIIAGITLTRLPEPRIVKILTITNLVIGIFWNYILLVFAIISLVQQVDYAQGYRKHIHEQ